MHRRQLPIAEPCGNDWQQMKGTASVRFCSACSKNVYNLSTLTERAAKAALAVRPDDACVRYHVDANGDVLFLPETAAARGHALHQKAIAALALSTIAACSEPISEPPAAAPVAVGAPPVVKDREPAQAQVTMASTPTPAKDADDKAKSCGPTWDDHFKPLTAAEIAMLKRMQGDDSVQGGPRRTSKDRS